MKRKGSASVRMDSAKAAEMPAAIDLQLATLHKRVPAGPGRRRRPTVYLLRRRCRARDHECGVQHEIDESHVTPNLFVALIPESCEKIFSCTPRCLRARDIALCFVGLNGACDHRGVSVAKDAQNI